MELIYLWVEDYKNIKNQGFNFSPRFECKYDEKNILTIEKKKYTSIFPDNINITAIVGENGSGKSSLANILLGKICDVSKLKNKKVLLLFFNGKNLLQYNDTITFSLINKTQYDLVDYNYKTYSINFDFSLGDGEIINDKSNYKGIYSIEPSRYYYSASPGGSSKIEHQSYNALMYSNALYFYKTFMGTDIIDNLNLPKLNKFYYKSKTSIGNQRKEDTLKSICNTKKINNPNFEEEYNKLENHLSSITLKSFFNEYQDIQEELLTLFKFRFEDDEKIDFMSLSKGQQYILSYLGILLRLQNKFENANVINIFFDEVESSFHPSWQKRFLNILLQFIKSSNLFSINQSINLLFITHSPFLLSDIPKENIIFLDKVESDKKKTKEKYPNINIDDLKDGNCINVSKHIKMQPFGANIHTLLADGFFMSDGLMGEFAKERIEEVIKLLNPKLKRKLSKKSKKFCEHVISIIGEPILKSTLENMLDEKIYEEESEINRLKRRQQKINEEIKTLEDKSNGQS